MAFIVISFDEESEGKGKKKRKKKNESVCTREGHNKNTREIYV